MRAKYEKFSFQNAISAMGDMGWCPLSGCNSLADIDQEANTGRCQHCEYLFCLDCKTGAHPFKRCAINRVDLTDSSIMQEISEDNRKFEEQLTKLYMKLCTRKCPNPKCGV